MVLRPPEPVAPHWKLPGIQIARAAAALSVVYFHSGAVLDRFPKDTAYPLSWLTNYGWIGVDVFFAISGYVICLLVSKAGVRPVPFIVKRVFRLYPLWLAALTLFAVSAWVWRGSKPAETVGFYFYSATLLPTNGFPFYDVGWSLQHELAFYVLCATIVPFAGIHGLAAFLAASAAAFHLVQLPWFLAQLAQYHADFLAGMLSFFALARLRFIGATALLVTGGTLLLLSLVLSSRALFLVALFFLIAGAASIPPSDNIVFRGAVGVGDSSYSLYLLHPLVLLAAKAVTIVLPHRPVWIEEPIRFGTIAVIIALSLLSWRYFERPAIDLGNRIARQFSLRPKPPSELRC